MKILLAWNILVCLLFALDKQKAIQKQWRVRESVLLFCAFTMGAAGALGGMYLFRHKTKKIKFKVLVPLFLLLNGVVLFGAKNSQLFSGFFSWLNRGNLR